MAGLKQDDFGSTSASAAFHSRHEVEAREQGRQDAALSHNEWVGDATRADRAVRLTRTIEAEIIPRLLLANSVPRQRECVETLPVCIGADDVTLLADMAVSDDIGDLTRLIEDYLDKGVSLESILLDLLSPTARRLGEYWEADTCTLVDVTIGLTKLQQLLRVFGKDFERSAAPWSCARRALLIPAQGETHTFGLLVLEAFFRRDGWDVSNGGGMSMSQLTRLVRRERFDIVCLSNSCDTLLDNLGSDISSLRRASRNKAVGMMVGGPAFNGRPDRVTLVGADATAVDAPQAVQHAARLFGASAERTCER